MIFVILIWLFISSVATVLILVFWDEIFRILKEVVKWKSCGIILSKQKER